MTRTFELVIYFNNKETNKIKYEEKPYQFKFVDVVSEAHAVDPHHVGCEH